jgi:hypothetical protein
VKYKFNIHQEGQPDEEIKEAMSYKRLLKALKITDPKWTGWIRYTNKKGKEILHSISNGKKI